ncbi:MAG: type I restriction enzyme HsdR N-terminal domain-containing protein [Cytophagales bacterium]|nr:type I restriction enzyme HsdR N-terminal domain-containing protein [Cytophagales bacterium]
MLYNEFIHEISSSSRIYDPIRRKWVPRTPEELVRQYTLFCLIKRGYPRSHIRVECFLPTKKGRKKRADILVYENQGKPYLLIECKRPDLELEIKAFQQMSIYQFFVQAHWIAITNGHRTLCWDVSSLKGLETLPQNIFPKPNSTRSR